MEHTYKVAIEKACIWSHMTTVHGNVNPARVVRKVLKSVSLVVTIWTQSVKNAQVTHLSQRIWMNVSLAGNVSQVFMFTRNVAVDEIECVSPVQTDTSLEI